MINEQYEDRMNELQRQLNEATEAINKLGKAFSTLGPLAENLNLRLNQLETKMQQFDAPIKAEEIHKEMERSGDSYDACENRLKQRRLNEPDKSFW